MEGHSLIITPGDWRRLTGTVPADFCDAVSINLPVAWFSVELEMAIESTFMTW